MTTGTQSRDNGGTSSVPNTRGKGTWLTATPDFASGVNQRQFLGWKNTWYLRAQVNANRESLLTTPNFKPDGDLRPVQASNEPDSLLTNLVTRGLTAEIAEDAKAKQGLVKKPFNITAKTCLLLDEWRVGFVG